MRFWCFGKRCGKTQETLEQIKRIQLTILERETQMAVNLDTLNATVTAVKASIDAAVAYIQANPNTDVTVQAALDGISNDLLAKEAELDAVVKNAQVPPVV
jgi:ElaB/YqjD/DUF883 family membrane-anchored ribosome-binding protein